MGIKRRDIVTSIILSIVTCGIYGIFWFISMVDDVRIATKDNSIPTGGTAFLLTIVTCGIYSIYLFYKLGKAMFESKISNSDNSVLYLVLTIFGLLIVNYCIIQNELNTYADNNR